MEQWNILAQTAMMCKADVALYIVEISVIVVTKLSENERNIALIF
jgi:hypothetical protein